MPTLSTSRDHTWRRPTRWTAVICIALIAACATTRASDAPPATAATEPELVPVIEHDRQMPLTRESPSPDPEHPLPEGVPPTAANTR